MSESIEFYRHGLGEAELSSLDQTLRSLFLTLGPRVREFEQRFSEYLGVAECVGVSSCSMGLILTLRAFDIGPGDEVITTPMSFVATSNAILHVGARPVFADIDPRTGLIDPEQVARKIGPRTRAILPVHLYGQLADMRALRRLADRHQLVLIEDAAHAVEAERDGVRTAQLGDAAVFSFYATKNLTSGDGGAVAVHDRALAEALRNLRNHGMSKDAVSRHGSAYQHWDMLELGYKAAMTDLNAALLLPQLGGIRARHALRAELVAHYERLLRALPEVELVLRTGRSAHHLFPVLLPRGTRELVLRWFGRCRIGCAVNYRSIHTLAYYRRRFAYTADAFPKAADFGERTLSLPLWPFMPHAHVERVVQALTQALRLAHTIALDRKLGGVEAQPCL
jgi:dTDP-4-amino-4,6-dideoxygalactose transaminase